MSGPKKAFDPKGDDTRKQSANMSGRAVRPKLAATLILLDDSGDPRVLMGKRHGGTRFMPHKYVFPGGRVDRADSFARTAGEIHPGALEALAGALPERRVQAAAAAAIRETFEETGYAIARPLEAPHKRPADWRDFYSCAGTPHISPLRLIARAVTPPYRPIRYDALFFMAAAEHARSVQGPCTPELEETAWVTLDEAESLDIPSITRFVLAEVRRRLDEPDAPVPYIRMERGRHIWTPLPEGASTA